MAVRDMASRGFRLLHADGSDSAEGQTDVQEGQSGRSQGCGVGRPCDLNEPPTPSARVGNVPCHRVRRCGFDQEGGGLCGPDLPWSAGVDWRDSWELPGCSGEGRGAEGGAGGPVLGRRLLAWGCMWVC